MLDKKCLKCGYERQPSDVAPSYECPECGAIYVYDKLNKTSNKKINAIERDGLISRIKFFFDFNQPVTFLKIFAFIFVPALLFWTAIYNTGFDPEAWVGKKISDLILMVS